MEPEGDFRARFFGFADLVQRVVAIGVYCRPRNGLYA